MMDLEARKIFEEERNKKKKAHYKKYDLLYCPKCGSRMDIDGLCCLCHRCDYVNDSTFNQISLDEKEKVDRLKICEAKNV